MLWLGSATALTRLIDVGASLFVIAMLSREQMGTAALALSAGIMVESFCGMGIGHALIQATHLTRDEEHSLFWLSSGIGLLQALLLGAAAPLLAHTYALPVLLPMVLVTAAKMLLISASVVPHQLLSKHLRFKQAGLAQTLCTLAEGSAKIGFAAAGLGAWALVLSNVVRGMALLGAVLWLGDFRPRRHFAWAEARGYLRFGTRIAASGLLYQGYRNADYFLVGKVLGVEALGLYRVAFEIGMMPLEVLINLINRVSYPIYANLAYDPQRLKAAFLRSTRSLTLLGAPIVVFLYVAAADLVALITSAPWADAVPAIQVLVWGSLLRALSHTFPQVYVAAGRPGYATLDSAVSLVTLVTLFACGLWLFPAWGSLSVCWAWLVAYPGLLQLHLVLTRRITPLATLEYLRALLPGLGGAALMLLAMLCLRPLELQAYGPVPSLIGSAAAGLGVYALYLRLALKVRLRDLAPTKQATIPL